jgi:hypothetical protein
MPRTVQQEDYGGQVQLAQAHVAADSLLAKAALFCSETLLHVMCE